MFTLEEKHQKINYRMKLVDFITKIYNTLLSLFADKCVHVIQKRLLQVGYRIQYK